MKATTVTIASLALASALHGQGVTTAEQTYLAARPGADFTFEPILTVGDRVPLTNGGAGEEYAFVGIPDAMGLYKDSVSGQNILFCAHEMNSTVLSQPLPGQTRYKGSFVSRFVLSATGGGVVSAAPAHAKLFLENTQVAARAPQEGDPGNGFSRFCSGAFSGPADGLDRPIFFGNEESSGSYQAKGPQSVAIYDGEMHILSSLGAIARETTRVQPRRDSLTAVISTEDGANPSFVYLYVGQKQRRSESALDKNGLTGGKIYVLAGRDAQHNEGTFTTGSLPVKWVEIPNGAALTDAQLRTAADAAGGFGFVRVEDGEYDPAQPTRSFFFSTTGGSASNLLGRLYELTLTPTNPAGPASLNVVYNADLVVTPGGSYTGATTGRMTGGGATGNLGNYTGGNINNGTDFPVSIDNIAVSRDFIVICEDTNSPAAPVYAKYGRKGGVWTLDRNNNYAAKYQADFNFAYVESRDGRSPLAAGLWEASGVIDSSAVFGPGTFVVNVQAHNSPRTNIPDGAGGFLNATTASQRFVEDGQLLIMRPTP